MTVTSQRSWNSRTRRASSTRKRGCKQGQSRRDSGTEMFAVRFGAWREQLLPPRPAPPPPPPQKKNCCSSRQAAAIPPAVPSPTAPRFGVQPWHGDLYGGLQDGAGGAAAADTRAGHRSRDAQVGRCMGQGRRPVAGGRGWAAQVSFHRQHAQKHASRWWMRPPMCERPASLGAGATPTQRTRRPSAPAPPGGRPSCESTQYWAGRTTTCGPSCRQGSLHFRQHAHTLLLLSVQGPGRCCCACMHVWSFLQARHWRAGPGCCCACMHVRGRPYPPNGRGLACACGSACAGALLRSCRAPALPALPRLAGTRCRPPCCTCLRLREEAGSGHPECPTDTRSCHPQSPTDMRTHTVPVPPALPCCSSQGCPTAACTTRATPRLGQVRLVGHGRKAGWRRQRGEGRDGEMWAGRGSAAAAPRTYGHNYASQLGQGGAGCSRCCCCARGTPLHRRPCPSLHHGCRHRTSRRWRKGGGMCVHPLLLCLHMPPTGQVPPLCCCSRKHGTQRRAAQGGRQLRARAHAAGRTAGAGGAAVAGAEAGTPTATMCCALDWLGCGCAEAVHAWARLHAPTCMLPVTLPTPEGRQLWGGKQVLCSTRWRRAEAVHAGTLYHSPTVCPILCAAPCHSPCALPSVAGQPGG